MKERPKGWVEYYKTLRYKYKQNTPWHKSQQYFFGFISGNNENEDKNKQWDLIKHNSLYKQT